MNEFHDGCKLRVTERSDMTEGAPDVESPRDVSRVVPEIRERVVMRRRRSRQPRRRLQVTWSVRASRRKIVRAFVVCTGVLVLMALSIYFGLSRQMAPGEGSMHRPALAPIAVRV
jgi:hypothetical protein